MASDIAPTNDNDNHSNNGVSRRDIKAAIAKAVELRALHAALIQASSPNGNNYSNNRRQASSSSCASPISRPVSGLSAQDYPVFTPSYEDEPSLPGDSLKNPKLSESWDECGGMEEEEEPENNVLSDFYKTSASKTTPPHDTQSQVCPMDDQKYPQRDFYASRRINYNLGDLRSVSSCNRSKPAAATGGFDTKSTKNSNMVVPLTDSHSSILSSQPRNRGVMSWLFPKLKKKNRNNYDYTYASPNNRTDVSDEVSQVLRDSSTMTIERLKRELMEANERRDVALMEVSEMKSSLGELSQKLEYLENYCERLKKALKQATTSRENGNFEKLGNFSRRARKTSIDGNSENTSMPVSEEVMVEGFLQIVSESRLSVRQFLKTLISQIDGNDTVLASNLNALLQPYSLSLDSKHSKMVHYHLEAIVNQSLYQDFENRVFQKNGTPKFLDPEQDRQAQFSLFVSLRNLSWNEVLKKGTKYYSHEFSKFCDQKMSSIITTLNWTRPWSEKLLQAFFIAAKCIWLVHLLAFSFNPTVEILRVNENRAFDSRFMEDVGGERLRSSSRGPASARVKVMVMPGFYVNDRALRCKVLCR